MSRSINSEKHVSNELNNSVEDVLRLKIDEKEINELKVTVKISYFPFIQPDSIDHEIPQGGPFQTNVEVSQGDPSLPQTVNDIPQGDSSDIESSHTPSLTPSGNLQRFLTGRHSGVGLIDDHNYMASRSSFSNFKLPVIRLHIFNYFRLKCFYLYIFYISSMILLSSFILISLISSCSFFTVQRNIIIIVSPKSFEFFSFRTNEISKFRILAFRVAFN